jgi:hypothetical protein
MQEYIGTNVETSGLHSSSIKESVSTLDNSIVMNLPHRCIVRNVENWRQMYDELFKSITQNWEGYRLAVVRVVGSNSYIFADDIIGDCSLKLMELLHSGRVKVSDVTYKDTNQINHSYFNRMVINRALDVLKSKRSNQLSEEYVPHVDEEEDQQQLFDSVDEVDYIMDRLQEYSKLGDGNWFHALLFEYIYIDGKSMLQLHRETKLSRDAIRKSRNKTLELVRGWLIEARQNNLIMKSKAVIGINEKGEKIVFQSCGAAAKAGYNNVKKSIEKGNKVKGYTFTYIEDDEPQGIRTIEEALIEESTGLGDTVAKVLHSPIAKPITNAVKQLFWGDDDCGCDERLNKLNNILPYNNRRPKRYFTKQEFEQFGEVVKKSPRVSTTDGKLIADLHAELFGHRVSYPCSSCGGGKNMYARWFKDLRMLYLKLEEEWKKS